MQLVSNFMNILSLHVPVPTVPSPLSPPSFSSFFLPRPQGKRGSTLAHISTESGARLRLGHEEELPPGNNHERIVYVTGRKAERDMALALIQDKVRFGCLPSLLLSHPPLVRELPSEALSREFHGITPLTHPSSPPARPSFLPVSLFQISLKVGGHHFGALSQGYGPDAVVVKVPVRCVGTLMGSRGFKMKEIKEKTGARVTLSKVRGKEERDEG